MEVIMPDRFCYNPQCKCFNITNFHGDHVTVEIEGANPFDLKTIKEIRRFKFALSSYEYKYFCEVCATAINMVIK